MSNQQMFHDQVMSELQMIQDALDEYNKLFPMDREIEEFAASHEKQAMPQPLNVANTTGNGD